jgi:hypothetical protein
LRMCSSFKNDLWDLRGAKPPIYYLELGLNCGLRTYCELVTGDSLVTRN